MLTCIDVLALLAHRWNVARPATRQERQLSKRKEIQSHIEKSWFR